MPKTSGARSRITHELLTHGAVVEKGGKATSLLKDKINYQGSHVGFCQLLTAMEREGEVVREIRGKRTYSIKLTAKSSDASQEEPILTRSRGRKSSSGQNGSNPTEVDQLDYEELAATLLIKVTRLLQRKPDLRNEAAWLRRIEELDAENSALQRDLARALTDAKSLKTERDEAREQLEAASGNLTLLSERLNARSEGRPSRTSNRMTQEDKQLLEQLRRIGGTTGESSEQAS